MAPMTTPSRMVPCTWTALGALMPPGLSTSHIDTPAGVGLPQRTQWLSG